MTKPNENEKSTGRLIPDPTTAPAGTVLFEVSVPEGEHPLLEHVRVIRTRHGVATHSVCVCVDGSEMLVLRPNAFTVAIALTALIDALRAEQAARIAAEARVTELERWDSMACEWAMFDSIHMDCIKASAAFDMECDVVGHCAPYCLHLADEAAPTEHPTRAAAYEAWQQERGQ